MRFYTGQHQHYCGIDLHASTMYVCILDAAGEIRVHRNVKSSPEALLEIVGPTQKCDSRNSAGLRASIPASGPPRNPLSAAC